MSDRISFIEYGMMLAQTASLRSEDKFRKVGSCAMDKNNRVIAIAYNGFPSGYNPSKDIWNDRELRQKYIIHSEQNLCSLFKRGDAEIVFCTTLPCTSCFQLLLAHGVKKIYFHEDYPASHAPELAKKFGIDLIQV